MRIAVFTHYLPPHVGGIEVVAENQISGLAAAGHHLSVVTTACGARAGLERSRSYSVRRITAWNYLEKCMGVAFPIPAPSILWHGYKAVKHADVVHAHDAFYVTSLVCAIWARILKKPLVLTQHVDMVPHSNSIVNLCQKLVYATSGRFILRTSRRVIVLNSRVRSFLVAKGIKKSDIVFVPNGVDTNTFAPTTSHDKLALREKNNLPRDKLLALFVGRFVPKKGLTILLDLPVIQGLGMVFVGAPMPTGQARGDRHFLGAINRAEIPYIFKACDIFVLPSQGEGFPVTVQEAMASGLPILAGADRAYEPYKLDESLVWLITPHAELISTALHELALDPGLRAQMGAYSRQYAIDHFSPQTHITELTAIYFDLKRASPGGVGSDEQPRG